MKFKDAGIIGLGTHVPEKIVTNFDFEKTIDTTDEWIRTRTCIEERRFVLNRYSPIFLISLPNSKRTFNCSQQRLINCRGAIFSD